MKEESYETAIEQLYSDLEEKLSRSDANFDWDIQEGILTVSFEDGSQIVLTRQAALKEIWMASIYGAQHFQFKNNGWITSQGEELLSTIRKIFNQYHIEVL